jgi:transcriptional regulator GlxA family with amidase domain
MREESSVQRAEYLVKQAMTSLQTDRVVAWRCLTDAATLLSVETEPKSEETGLPFAFRPGGLARWQARRTLSYIEDNLGTKLNVGQLAALVALSKSHFSRAFSRAIGFPPMVYVAARRIERAKRLMSATREPLSHIALACGFSDQPHFNKLFRRRMGMSPGIWRRRFA